MTITEIFNEVYDCFINGNYSIANPKDRQQTKAIAPPKMEHNQALQHTVNYILWEWTNDKKDDKFKNLIKVVCLPPKDYDMSAFTFKQVLEVICPEIIKTNPEEFK